LKADEAQMMSDQHNTVMLRRIESRIQVIRGLRVMLDVDLAALHGVANWDHLQNLTDPPERPIQGHDKCGQWIWGEVAGIEHYAALFAQLENTLLIRQTGSSHGNDSG
jgi:hypothetical protein